ncbi:MFS transporter, partial [Candidatus Dojkabacteria bacterium]|nr:MFS transporter [Candidatus Dojkabacteria bacterium]
VDPQIFVLMWIMIFISFLFFLSLIFWTKDTFLTGPSAKEEAQPKSFTREAIAWSKLFRVIWSPLIFICFFAIYDSFFYTIGPLMAESYQGIGIYSGLILAAYWVPTFLVSMFTQRLTRRFGKKRTAYFGLLIAALPLLIFFVGDSPVLAAAIFFVSASFSSFSVPAISSAYTDYINEAHKYEEEIEAISDFLDNLGYIVGPIIAGVLADRVGYEFSFGWLGIGLIVTLLLLVKLTPKHIRISNRVID